MRGHATPATSRETTARPTPGAAKRTGSDRADARRSRTVSAEPKRAPENRTAHAHPRGVRP